MRDETKAILDTVTNHARQPIKEGNMVELAVLFHCLGAIEKVVVAALPLIAAAAAQAKEAQSKSVQGGVDISNLN